MTLDQQGTLMPADAATPAGPSTFVIKFAFVKPPLRVGDNLGRIPREQMRLHVVTTTMWHARRIPLLTGPVEVALAWNVNDGIRRKPERMRPTLDAMLRGLVQADVLEHPDHRAAPVTTRLAVNVIDKADLPVSNLTLTITKDAA